MAKEDEQPAGAYLVYELIEIELVLRQELERTRLTREATILPAVGMWKHIEVPSACDIPGVHHRQSVKQETECE